MRKIIRIKYLVVLTGGIGSGKTTVSNIFSKLGVDVIDADIISKNILVTGSKILRKIFKKFGKKIKNEDYSLNRKILRKSIFKSSYLRKWLNNLLHPIIYSKIYKEIEKSKSIWCLIVIPLLIESKIKIKADRILVVDTTIQNQINRIILRDNEDKKNIKKIIFVQAKKDQRLMVADDIIVNNKNLKSLFCKVKNLHKYYCILANKKIIFLQKYNNITN